MENIGEGNNPSQESFSVNLDALDETQIGGEAEGSQTSSVHTNTDDLGKLEIDPRYKDLPIEEATLRTLQSQRDSARSQINKFETELSEYRKVSELFDNMLTDEGLLMAFISEVKPDLVKGVDKGAKLKEQLKKEFGEDFKPGMTREEAERDDPFGRDAEYYARVDELRQQLKQGSPTQAATVKEYLARKKQAEEAEAKRYEQEREVVKTELKMSDDEMKAVSEWALKLGFKDIVKVHRFLRRTQRLPGLTTAPGDQPGVKSEASKFLDSLFGNK